MHLETWGRREIENYIAQPKTLLAWAQAEGEEKTGGPLFAVAWQEAMEQAIAEVETALRTLGRLGAPEDIKASEEYLEPIFGGFYRRLGLPNLMNKSDYHQLARFVDPSDIDADVLRVLDGIADTAAAARPRAE